MADYLGHSTVVSVGVDLVQISDVRSSLERFGDRYLQRIFTDREVADSARGDDPAPGLAARFAAKEATIKALRVDGPIPNWTSMEVRRNRGGWCDEMILTGHAAELAVRAGIARVSVSLSHESDFAVAFVVATRSESEDWPEPFAAGRGRSQ
jgi:holo-[acyl-carrier protein] synthase